jgi:hypothetical protein
MTFLFTFEHFALSWIPALDTDHYSQTAPIVSLLETMLIEVAKMAPRNTPDLATIYDPEYQKGKAHR